LALDLAKYRALFLEEAAEHLSEISGALLALEKDLAAADPIDVAFRMAHSIKSMAASLEYDSITELAHALEDRMERIRSAGCVAASSELVPLFAGLEGLEAMVRAVRETGEPPALEAGLVERVRGTSAELEAADAAPASAPPGDEADRDAKKKTLLTT
jgi:two-component system chemotaxis sensor kinase CheA